MVAAEQDGGIWYLGLSPGMQRLAAYFGPNDRRRERNLQTNAGHIDRDRQTNVRNAHRSPPPPRNGGRREGFQNRSILDAYGATSLEYVSCVSAVRYCRVIIQNTVKPWEARFTRHASGPISQRRPSPSEGALGPRASRLHTPGDGPPRQERVASLTGHVLPGPVVCAFGRQMQVPAG